MQIQELLNKMSAEQEIQDCFEVLDPDYAKRLRELSKMQNNED